jgi:hypothetical protein
MFLKGCGGDVPSKVIFTNVAFCQSPIGEYSLTLKRPIKQKELHQIYISEVGKEP